MKALYHVAPATFGDGMYTIAIPYQDLDRGEFEARNAAELRARLAEIRLKVNADGFIFVKPLDRKCNGFDKVKREERAIFFTHKQEAQDAAA